MVNKRKTLLFSDEDIQKIESKIKALEKQTSGEIVVQVLPTSESYLPSRLFAFITGLGLASIWCLYSEYTHQWIQDFREILFMQVSIGLCMAFAATFKPVARLLVSKSTMAAHTHREAMALFTKLGIANTHKRSGILIFLSAFERQVVILADEGIHKKVDDAYWEKEATTIAAGFREKRPAEALIQSLERMSELLKTHFPFDPNDVNELPDEVRFK